MKVCPNCNTQLNDSAAFCTNCGTQFAAQPQPNSTPQYDPYDHTAEFDRKDISDNKVIAMLVYLMGAIGVIIALLASNSSKYVSFHLRQALKFLVVEIVMLIALFASAVLCIIPVLGWFICALVMIAVCIAYVILFVLKIVCFFQICSGKAKEPAIIRGLNFLR